MEFAVIDFFTFCDNLFFEKILEINVIHLLHCFSPLISFYMIITIIIYFQIHLGVESDEEIRRVPEIGSGEVGGASASGREMALVAGPDRVQASSDGQRKRGRSPADKENKRLKR